MDIVDKVAAEIAEIPGSPSAHEIARIAIEAYQKALWTPAFDVTNRAGLLPEPRRHRASQITANVMQILDKYLCDHGDSRAHRDASEDLFETFYESGAEIISDFDRSQAGVPPRGAYGLTATELHIIETRRIEAMLRPMAMVQPLPHS